MPFFRKGVVRSLKPIGSGISRAAVSFGEGEPESAIVLDDIVGSVEVGDEVICNTTAVTLGLGSGGEHYVLWNISRDRIDKPTGGHIMKLRYTPLQIDCLTASDQSSKFHEVMKNLENGLEGIPVLVGTVHSQLSPAAITLKRKWRDCRTAFVMTDGGSLPLNISDTVRFLKKREYIIGTVSCGHAFGGDVEAVNVFEGLLAARRILGADAIVVTMGPGIVGTGTEVGFTGMEQGTVLDCASSLGGVGIAIPRISFQDPRPRHKGLSHHTVSALRIATHCEVLLPIPAIEEEKQKMIREQVVSAGLDRIHKIRIVDAGITLGAMKEAGWHPTVMGRTVDEEPEYFMAAGAAAILAADLGGQE